MTVRFPQRTLNGKRPVMIKAILKKYWKMLLSMILVSALGVGILTGLTGSFSSLVKNLDQYLEEYNYPDAVITTEVVPKKRIEDLLKAEGVEHAEGRLAADSVIENAEGRMLSIRAFSFSPEDRQVMHVWSGTIPDGSDDALLAEVLFARDNNIQVGDTIRVRVDEEFRPFRVAGLISMPEDLSVRENKYSSGLNPDFGYLYVPLSVLNRETEKKKSDESETIKEKESELSEAKEEAESLYQDALEKIEEGRSELQKKISEFRRVSGEMEGTLKELADKEKELLNTESDTLAKKAELEAKVEEALAKQKELNETREQVLSLLEEIEEGLKEADEKEAELLATKKEVLAKKEELTKQKQELEEKLSQLEEAKAALQKIAEAEAALEAIGEEKTVQALNLLRRVNPSISVSWLSEIADAILRFVELCKKYGIIIDIDQPVCNAEGMILNKIDQLNADYAVLSEENAKAIVQLAEEDESVISSPEYQRIKEAAERYVSFADNPEAALDQAVIAVTELLENSRAFSDELRSEYEGMQESGQDVSITYRELLEIVRKLKDYASLLEELTEKEITTVGEFAEACDEVLANMDELIETLKKQRAEIIEQLREAGVEEDKIDETIETIRAGIQEIDDGFVQIEEGLQEIEDGLALISEKRKEADEGLGLIDEAMEEIEDGLSQIEDGLKEAEPLREQIRSGLAEIEEGLRKVRGGREEIETGLADSQKQINEASNTIAKKESEVEEEWAKQLKEFENLREEIDQAYQELDDSEGYEDLCNQFQIYFEKDADPETVLKRCEDLLGDVEIKDSYNRESSDVNRRIHSNTDPLEKLAGFMPVVFYAVIITVIFLFMSILVRLCRREIGILMALGISRGEIRRLFSGVGLVVSIGSYLPGLGIGWILIRLISRYFYHFFPLPFRVSEFDGSKLLPALIVTVLAVQAATFIGTSLISAIQPSEAMTRSTESPPQIPKLLDFLLRPLKELEKYSVLSLFRNPLRFVLTVICISATSILIFSSMSFLASKQLIISQLFHQRIFYDCEVFTSEGKQSAIAKKLNALDYVELAEPSRTYFSEVSFQENSKSVMISSIAKESDMTGLIDSSGNRIMPEESGIVLDRYTAETIGADIGDTVKVDNVPVKLTGLSDQYISRVQYVSEAQADRFGKESIGTILVRLPKERAEDLRHYLSEQDGFLYTIFTDSLYSGINSLYETYDLYAWILVGFSVVIGLLIVLNITETTLLEQKKQLCVLRTLGFSVPEIGKNLFSQSILRFLGSLIIGLPIGSKIAEYGLSLLKSSDRVFPFQSGVKEYLFTAGIVFIYILISHIISILRMYHWDIVENVKDKE